MPKHAAVIGWGFLISSLGSIPLGALNVTAMQVSINEGIGNAILFSAGVAIVEIAYVRISLIGIHWLLQNVRLLKLMDIVSIVILIMLAVGSFFAAMHDSASGNSVLKINLPFFVVGILMSALNPVQIPFWLGWSSFLFSKKILLPFTDFYNWYTIGIGAGTITGLAVFVFAGRFIVNILNANMSVVNFIIGFVFLITALVQVIKMLRHRGLAEATKEKVAELESEVQKVG